MSDFCTSGGTEGPTRGQNKKDASAADVGAWDGAVALQQVLIPNHSLARARVGVVKKWAAHRNTL
jgi:hypothetical protein